MRKFWVRSADPGLERELRAYRAEPRDAFVASVSERVARERAPRGRASRLAFAAAFTTFVVGTSVSFGGVSYAASAAGTTAGVVKRVVDKAPLVRVESSASDQYKPPKPPKAPNVGQVGGVTTTPTGGQAPSAFAAAPTAAGTLPFTGISLGVTTLLGATLIGTGVLLRRRERSG